MKRHQVGMSLDMSCLFLLVSVNPDFACVFLGSYLLVLLHDLIKKLLALDFILLL
jgi:hypothetical protein